MTFIYEKEEIKFAIFHHKNQRQRFVLEGLRLSAIRYSKKKACPIFCYQREEINLYPSRSRVKRENQLKFIFALLCGASKGFMKTLKAFMKPFETLQKMSK